MADLLKTTVVLDFIAILLRHLVSLVVLMPIGAPLLALIYFCPNLSCDYFKAGMTRVHHRLFIPSAMMLAAAQIHRSMCIETSLFAFDD